jgi:hypothetical protein
MARRQRTDAELRAIAKAGAQIRAESWEEAEYFVDHSFVGAAMVLREHWLDVCRAARDALPGPLRRRLTR